jgi:hypothetical protein
MCVVNLSNQEEKANTGPEGNYADALSGYNSVLPLPHEIDLARKEFQKRKNSMKNIVSQITAKNANISSRKGIHQNSRIFLHVGVSTTNN